MNRREFLFSLLAVPLATAIPFRENKLDKIRKLMKEAMEEYCRQIDEQLLYGIPYHYNDGTTGRWIGLERQ